MHGERGYTLVGLVIAVAIVNVSLAVAVTSWTTIDRRASEAELIWRGQQIGRAIACYQANSPTQPLTKLEQLVEANCLRRLYSDPMVKDGKWRILTQQDVQDGTVAALTGQAAPDAATSQPGMPGMQGGQGTAQAFAQRQGTRPGLSGLFQRSQMRLSAGGADAIVGVVSRSEATGLRSYSGRQKYGEWVFLAASGS